MAARVVLVGPGVVRRRLPLLISIVRKDLRASRGALLALTAVMAVIFFILLGVAYQQSATFAGKRVPPANPAWNGETVRAYYGFALAASFIVFTLATLFLYNSELSHGTVRLLLLYPVGLNTITFSKMVSITLVGTLVCMEVLFLPIVPFTLFLPVPPDLLSGALLIVFIACIAAALALLAGFYAGHILQHLFPGARLSPPVMGILFLVLSLLLTETGVGLTLSVLVSLFSPIQGIDEAEYAARQYFVEEQAGFWSLFSPYHAGGRIVSGALAGAGGSSDTALLALLTVVILFSGIWLARRTYPDLFIREYG